MSSIQRTIFQDLTSNAQDRVQEKNGSRERVVILQPTKLLLLPSVEFFAPAVDDARQPSPAR